MVAQPFGYISKHSTVFGDDLLSVVIPFSIKEAGEMHPILFGDAVAPTFDPLCYRTLATAALEVFPLLLETNRVSEADHLGYACFQYPRYASASGTG